MQMFFYGLSTSLGLIVAIGAQNIFVLKQGILKQHVGIIVAICACSDMILITAGALGMGFLLKEFPILLDAFRYGGALFLAVYGLMAAKRAYLGNSSLVIQDASKQTLKSAVLLCLGFTFLNPHVYLDTMILMGAIISSLNPGDKWEFAIGACSGSFLWFPALGYGARLLIPVFQKETAWRVLDIFIAAFMLFLAAMLAFEKI